MLIKPKMKAPIITIVASPGVGKTTLAGLFPNPVFIQAEDAETVFSSWPVDDQPYMMPRLPRPSKTSLTSEVIRDQLAWLFKNDHDRETVVIDSVTSLNEMFERELCLVEGVAAVGNASGGFNKGFNVVADMHSKVRSACESLRNQKNMAIVFLAHVGVHKKKSTPDTDEYSFYSLAMNQESIPQYVNHSDAVVYIKKDQFVTGKETNRKGQVTKFGKIVDTGERTIITSNDGRTGYIDAKSRYSEMPAEIPLLAGENPLLQYIPFFNKTGK